MKYSKQALSFPEQADRLLTRGLVADRDTLVARLEVVNYYRLSAYWYTFRIPGDPSDRLFPGTTLDAVWSRYVFDRQLRLLVMDAIGATGWLLCSPITRMYPCASWDSRTTGWIAPFGKTTGFDYGKEQHTPGIDQNLRRRTGV